MTQVKHLQNFSGNAALTAVRSKNPPAFAAALAGQAKEWATQLILIIAGRTL